MDMNLIYLHPCPKAESHAYLLGEQTALEEHEAMLEPFTWKTAAQRPQWKWTRCGAVWWSTLSLQKGWSWGLMLVFLLCCAVIVHVGCHLIPIWVLVCLLFL